MNVGLITCTIDNMGACLQAYALQHAIKSFGFGCDIIPYSRRENGRDKMQSWTKKVKRSLLHFPTYCLNQRRNRLYAEGFAQRREKFEQFRDNWLVFSDEAYDSFEDIMQKLPAYDAYVCGSDQIWNPLLHHNDPVYYLDFVPEGKSRIAYAPSIGISKIPEEYMGGMAELLRKMTYLSVREKQGALLVKELSGRQAQHVVDPTLLINSNDWSVVMNQIEVPNQYILLYLFGDLSYIGKTIELLREQTNLPIVSVPYVPREIDDQHSTKVFDAGPSEFIWLIKNATLVCTDSFHATAFAINFNTPFYSLCRQEPLKSSSMLSRLTSILGQFGLEHRLLYSQDSFPSGGHLDVDFGLANEKILEMRRDSLAYLERALVGK